MGCGAGDKGLTVGSGSHKVPRLLVNKDLGGAWMKGLLSDKIIKLID